MREGGIDKNKSGGKMRAGSHECLLSTLSPYAPSHLPPVSGHSYYSTHTRLTSPLPAILSDFSQYSNTVFKRLFVLREEFRIIVNSVSWFCICYCQLVCHIACFSDFECQDDVLFCTCSLQSNNNYTVSSLYMLSKQQE